METAPPTPQSAISTVSSTSTQSSKGSSTLKSRTKVVYFWRSEEVNKWLRKNCGQYHQLYGETFSFHDINGRSLMRLTDMKLQMMGIEDPRHREELMRHILRLKLKTEAKDFKALEEQKDTKGIKG